jgi:hypothetical protein
MPLREVDGVLMNVCVNAGVRLRAADAPPVPGGFEFHPMQTMFIMDGWGGLPGVGPPEHGRPSQPLPRLMPLRVWACHVCGYTEMYMGQVVAPEVWHG